MEIAHDNIKQLFGFVMLPVFRKCALPVVAHIMASIQHSPEILKLLVKPICSLYSKTQLDTQQLTDTLAALLWLFPASPEYNDIVNSVWIHSNEHHVLKVFCIF